MSLLDTASLIVTPSGYKEGKLYSVIPSDGSGDLSVTRATTATRVNSAGLVELVPYNLCLYSQDFANWLPAGGAVASNTSIAPDGTLTADTLNGLRFLQGFGTNVFTFSCYAKANGGSGNFWLRVDVPATNQTTFDLTNGTYSAPSGYTASIENVGNGWYRCTMTTPSVNVINAVVASSDYGTNETLIWGAQLVEGSTAKDYQKTETRLNIPRLDYSNGTCPSLLVEPQRTNRVLYSSSFDNAAWDKGPYNTIVANAIVSPDGTQNADKIQSSVSGTQIRYTNQAISSATGTYSIYMKAGEQTQCLMYLGGGANDGIFWNLTNGTFISYYGSGSVITSYSSEDVGNGWFRYKISSSSAFSYAEIYMSVNQVLGSNIPVGNGFYLWGAQVEVGSYATSYIPTTSASVTRNADVISKTGISSLIGQTEGTIFIDLDFDNLASQTNNPVLFSLLGNATIYMQMFTSGYGELIYSTGAGTQAYLYWPSVTNGHHKIAFGYKANDFVLYIDGVQVATDTSGSVDTLSSFYFAYINSAFNPTANYKAAALWKTRLTNAQLATLTTI